MYLVDESAEGEDSVAGLTTAKDLDAVDVQARRGRSRHPTSCIHVRPSWQSRDEWAESDGVAAEPGCWFSHPRKSRIRPLGAGDFSNVVHRGPRWGPALAAKCGSRGKTQHRCCLRADTVLTEPAPNGGVADRGNKPRPTHMLGELHGAPAQRNAQSRRQLASDCLDFDVQALGGKTRGRPGVAVPPAPGVVARTISFATDSPLRAACSDFVRFHRWKDPQPPAESSSRERHENTATYISEGAVEVPLLFLRRQSYLVRTFAGHLLLSRTSIKTSSAREASDNTLVYL